MSKESNNTNGRFGLYLAALVAFLLGMPFVEKVFAADPTTDVVGASFDLANSIAGASDGSS